MAVRTTPAPAGASVAYTNEPGGMTLISDTGFAAGHGWTLIDEPPPSGPAGTMRADVVDATDPSGTDSRVAEFTYPLGFTSGGYSPGRANPPAIGASRTELFLGFHWRASNPWHNHEASGVNKIFFGWLNAAPPPWCLAWYWSAGQDVGGGVTRTKVLGLFNAGSSQWLWPNQGGAACPEIVEGTWYKIELWLQTHASAAQYRLWLNGVLYASGTPTAFSGVISDCYYDPTWGGAGGPVKAQQDYYRIGRTRLSVRS